MIKKWGTWGKFVVAAEEFLVLPSRLFPSFASCPSSILLLF